MVAIAPTRPIVSLNAEKQLNINGLSHCHDSRLSRKSRFACQKINT
jgi:hypothetical protein